MDEIDITIIGAGVIGLAVAYELADGKRTITVLEKNSSFGQETSSRNSEVIHSGIYYPYGFLKASLCVEGAKLLYELCQKTGIDYKAIKICAEKDIWIGPEHLDPWCDGYRGFNGKCLPKDTEAFLAWADQQGADLSVLRGAVEYNSKLLESQNVKKDS